MYTYMTSREIIDDIILIVTHENPLSNYHNTKHSKTQPPDEKSNAPWWYWIDSCFDHVIAQINMASKCGPIQK